MHGTHERPINSKCKVIIGSDSDSDTAEVNTSDSQATNQLIFQKLKNLNGRMAEMEE